MTVHRKFVIRFDLYITMDIAATSQTEAELFAKQIGAILENSKRTNLHGFVVNVSEVDVRDVKEE